MNLLESKKDFLEKIYNANNINKKGYEIIIDGPFLKDNPDLIFVFGDNLERVGMGGAAKLRYFPNTYGFVTKKTPGGLNEDYYTVDEYSSKFEEEFNKLKNTIENNPDKTYLISKIGAGLANRYKIWENVIVNRLHELKQYGNIRFLFDIDSETNE